MTRHCLPKSAVYSRVLYILHVWTNALSALLVFSQPWTSSVLHLHSCASKSVPQPVTLKKLKLNGSMKTYKTF